MGSQPMPPLGPDRHDDDLDHWADQFIGQSNRLHAIGNVILVLAALALLTVVFAVWL
jgi:hypothetical protein